MKKTILSLALAVLTIGLLNSCSKVDSLEKRVDTIEKVTIVSIQSQVADIQQSIADLGTIRTNVQNLMESAASKSDIDALNAADAALDERIKALEGTAVDLSKYAEKDWVQASFVTLEAFNQAKELVEDLAKTVGKLSEDLGKAIEDATKNVTAAISALEERVSALEKMIQKVTVIPVYNDGSVKVAGTILNIDCVVSPAEAVVTLKKENFEILVDKVITKASDLDTVAVSGYTADTETGIISLKADIKEFTAEDGGAITVAVSVKNGISDYVTDFVNVTYTDPVAVESVSLDKTELKLSVGDEKTLVATVLPEDAANKNVSWTSSRDTVATVGVDGKVIAVAAGETTITVTTEDGAKTATCTVVVRSKGEGTEASPYLLYEAEDLLKLRELCKEISDDSSVEKADAATPTYFKLMEDIDLTGVDWTPYNYNGNYLRKIDFNGNHKTISNLTCEKNDVYASVFGVLFGTVYDLNVKNANIKSNQTAGIMCGYLGTGNKKGHIHNCSVQGKVETTNSPTGGLVGQNGVGGDIYECYVDAEVVETANKNFVGGLIGYDKVNGCAIRDCIVKGSVNGYITEDGGGTQRVGGIMGMLYKENSSVINCIALNTLKGARCIGGIVGHANMDKWDERHPNNTVKGCIAWNPEIISTQINEDGATNGAIVGFGSEYNTYADCVRKPDMKYTYPDPGFAEGENNPDGKYNTFFDQENSSDTDPLKGIIHDNGAKLYRTPYNGKAATAGETASQVAKRLGWDETIWDLSGDTPSLKRVYAE